MQTHRYSNSSRGWPRRQPVILLLSLLALTGCTSVPATAPTATETTVASAVDDAVSVGLVPVLAKNPAYIPAAQALGAGLSTFAGDTLTPADVHAFLSAAVAKGLALSPSDQATVEAVINAAWSRYAKNYQSTVTASVRPDVKLFLAAVADGITTACAAVPKST